jgi:hypothetical protein
MPNALSTDVEPAHRDRFLASRPDAWVRTAVFTGRIVGLAGEQHTRHAQVCDVRRRRLNHATAVVGQHRWNRHPPPASCERKKCMGLAPRGLLGLEVLRARVVEHQRRDGRFRIHHEAFGQLDPDLLGL